MKKEGKSHINFNLKIILTFLSILSIFAFTLTITSAESPLLSLKDRIIFSLSDIVSIDEDENQVSEFPSDIPRPAVTTSQCKTLCTKNYTEEIKICNKIHRNVVHQCNDLRKQMLEECTSLKGKERRACIKNVEKNGKRCKESALEDFNICKAKGRENLMLCKSFCEPITCCLNDSECFKTTINQCRSEKGAVMECLPVKRGGRPKISQSQNFTLINTTTQSDWLKNLTDLINSTNISSAPYIPGRYVCHNFTDDLERNLTAAGYNATFTAYWCYNNAGNPTIAHAVTDIHTPDGSLVFIEPQTGQITNLDFDGDGKTEARTHHENAKKLTDNNCEIEVYDSKAAALAAGVPM